MMPINLLGDGRIGGGVNRELTPEVSSELGSALGTMLGERVLVVAARDYYPPSRMLKRAFSAGLMSTGVTVVDFHAATFPELAFAVKKFGAKAGVHFAVSPFHSDHVNIRLLDYLGIEFSQDRLNQLLRLFDNKHFVRTLPERIGWVTYAEYIHEIYVASVTSYVDSEIIAHQRPRIAVDVNFGPAAEVLPDMFSELSVDSITLNAHKPPARHGIRHIPSYESLISLGELVKAAGAEFGAALSIDAGRIIFIDDKGRIIDTDKLAALLVSSVSRGSRVVTTLTTSKLIDKIAQSLKLKIVRVRGLPGDLSRQIRRNRGVLGVSDEGEIIYPTFSLSPDGLLSLSKMLEHVAKEERPVSSLINSLPEISVHKEEISYPERFDATYVLDYLYSQFAENSVHAISSVKIIHKNTIVKVEPIKDTKKLRLSVEMPSRKDVEALRELRDEISNLLGGKKK